MTETAIQICVFTRVRQSTGAHGGESPLRGFNPPALDEFRTWLTADRD